MTWLIREGWRRGVEESSASRKNRTVKMKTTRRPEGLGVEQRSEPGSGRQAAQVGRSKAGRVLLVDDSDVVCHRVKDRLCREGYEVVTVADPTRVRFQIANSDIALIDYHMPGYSGAEILRTVRQAAMSAGARAACLVYTFDKTISLKHRELGFDGSIINKGDDESLVHQLAVALRLAKLNILRHSTHPRW
jgi:CheY-like chemotaxis protein